jgi:hypothetical protein
VSTSDQLKLIRLDTPLLRALLLVPVALAVFGSWCAFRWYLGSELALFAPRMAQGGADTARSAINLSPADPGAHWSLATLEMKNFAPESLQLSVREYEKAVSLSPNDYRLWVDLGRAREREGDTSGAEKALRRAIELAPTYYWPRWHFGNFLLRAGRAEESFRELRHAGDADPSLRSQIFELAWRVYDGNAEQIKAAVGDSAAGRADLISYLVNRKRLDDALGLWSSLKDTEKKEQRVAGEILMAALLQEKRYRAAFDVSHALVGSKDEKTEPPLLGQVANGSFETAVGQTSNTGTGVVDPFAWQVASTTQAQAALDTHDPHAGRLSLRIVFNAPSTVNAINIYQLIAVEPSTTYRLECYVRTRDLKSAGTPVIELAEETGGQVLGASEPLQNGTVGWQLIAIEFKTGEKTEAVTLRVNRAPCGSAVADGICPIFGTVWYDDFNLKRIG